MSALREYLRYWYCSNLKRLREDGYIVELNERDEGEKPSSALDIDRGDKLTTLILWENDEVELLIADVTLSRHDTEHFDTIDQQRLDQLLEKVGARDG